MSSTPVEPRGHRVAEYEEWVKEQRIPIHEGYFVSDFKTIEVGPILSRALLQRRCSPFTAPASTQVLGIMSWTTKGTRSSIGKRILPSGKCLIENWQKGASPPKCRPSATRRRTLTLTGEDRARHQARKKNLMQAILLRE